MSEKEMLRSAENAPDHGRGPLGKVAHTVLAENLGGAPAEPKLHLCCNTMPDPAFPMAGVIGMEIGPGVWAACGEDFGVYLGAVAERLRGMAVPEPGSFGPQEQTLQRMLRYDAAALCFRAHAMSPETSPAAAALAANLVEGRLHPGDLEVSPGARPVTVVWAADRAGDGLIMFVPPDGSVEQFEAVAKEADSGDVILAGLAEVARAQHEWTSRAFDL